MFPLRVMGALPVVPMHLPHRLSVVTPKGDTGISDDFRVIVTRYAIAPALVRFKFANSVLEYSSLPADGQSDSLGLGQVMNLLSPRTGDMGMCFSARSATMRCPCVFICRTVYHFSALQWTSLRQ